MINYFDLVRKTTAPTSGAITVLPYYKNNSTPINLSVTGATFMKVWINQSATGSITDPEFPSAWIANASTWTPNFSTEGTNYVHALFADDLGNYVDVEGNPIIVNSSATFYDATVPAVTATHIANIGSPATAIDITASQDVIIRVTADDYTEVVGQGSGIAKTNIFGALDAESTTEFVWSDADRTAGYKDCQIKLHANTVGTREAKVINATATDRAGNESARKDTTVIYYTGGLDPVMVLKDGNDVIGDHYGKTEFKAELDILTGEASFINGYKIWGDFTTTSGGTTPTPKPDAFTPWGSSTKVTIDNLYFTAIDGNKVVQAAVRLNVNTADIQATVATYADLPGAETAVANKLYEVTTDETKSNANTIYKRLNGEWYYYGVKTVDGGTTYADHDIESSTVHHSEALPTISMTTNKSVVSDKTGFDTATLTATLTTSCAINTCKVVAYGSQTAAEAGTYSDATNTGIISYDERESGSTFAPDVTEAVLVQAVAGEGTKYLVVYAKNKCDKWGKSNIIPVSVDLTAPVGQVSVNAYYNAASGFTASATDANTVSKMTVWVDNVANNEVVPTGATEYDYVANPTADKVNGWTTLVESATSYVHIKYVDSVGNYSFTHSVAFTYDKTAPTAVTLTLPARTNTPTLTASISATDAVSGLGQMKVFGDIDGASTSEQAQWVDYSTSYNITLTNGDGNKTVQLLVKDKAGNVIATAVSATTSLDTTAPSATLVLYNADNTAVLPNKVNQLGFTAHLGATETLTNIAQYKVYGSVQGKESEQAVEWATFTPDAGQTYMSVTGLNLTTGEGLKTVNVKLKDTHGNVSGAAFQTVTYDTSVPEISISGLDYARISNKTTERLTASGTVIANTRNDKVTFKFSSNQKLQSYKVCVYDSTKTAEQATAISMTGGSMNMSGGVTEANVEVSCTLMDADFKEHSKVAGADGAYKVIVYGKNEAGSWSSSDPITA